MEKPPNLPDFPLKPKLFPDAATCKVRRFITFGADELQECLSCWGAECPHVLFFGGARFCLRPEAVP